MSSRTFGKNRAPASIRYGSLMHIGFGGQTVVASQANTAINGRIPLAANIKIVAVAVTAYGGAAGTNGIQIVNGAGAVGARAVQLAQGNVPGQYPDNKVAQPGETLFAANQAVTMTNESVSVFYNDQMDVVWPAGSLLTLRSVTNGAAAGNFRVDILAEIVDLNPTNPQQHNQYFVPAPGNI